ncbi:Acetyltransferase (GNAT) family protein [Stieleria maiorica]|uniref:Acetyltransferase (GNAT) family protein n=1 Tax=Stieleria maiorica TaxID=2795974 RepID=A0A5B9MJ93_9BACT|nr:GNAT family N-acetyltransferase [Stieleria maiorica]QEG00041.1 Acetyltransferase (GNAT) family protein [Stieleria maiorica]
MSDAPCHVRQARPKDVPEIFAMLRELAIFEKLEHQLTASEDDMHQALFVGRHAEALVAEVAADDPSEPQLVGYAIYFENFSTFLCKPGIYLEDIYVRPAFRNRGIGKKVLQTLAGIAVERKCGRMEWAVLDWNQNAIDVYQAIGGDVLPDWRITRLGTDAIEKLAGGCQSDA